MASTVPEAGNPRPRRVNFHPGNGADVGAMRKAKGRILVIDDDSGVLTAAKLLLKRHFAVVQTESDPRRLPELLRNGFDVLLLDMNFAPGANTGQEGFNWLETSLETDPSLVVVLMTAYGDVATAVEAMKRGATDFVMKPWQNEKLIATVTAGLQLRNSRAEVEQLRQRNRELGTSTRRGVSDIIGSSEAMSSVLDIVRRAAPTDANILILGENGTGKELIARAVHAQSMRADEVFLSVDLGAVNASLFESELFGHRKGAFTDAREDRAGRFQAASGGTLFLDEIGNLPMHLQGRLLRALEERIVTPLGSDKGVAVDVRLICATNMPLSAMCQAGEFREDLLYRINTVEIQVPSLRERGEDIAVLLEHFVAFYADKYGVARKQISQSALKRLAAHHWPGNVRELRHAVERALILSDSPVLDVHDFLLPAERNGGDAGPAGGELNLEAVEQQAIRRALEKHTGNVSRAAQELGITRASLYRRMEKYGL